MKVSKDHRPEAADKPFEDKGLDEANSGAKIKKTQRHNKHIGGIIYIAILLFSLFIIILPSYTKLKEINDSLDRINRAPNVHSPADKVIVDKAGVH